MDVGNHCAEQEASSLSHFQIVSLPRNVSSMRVKMFTRLQVMQTVEKHLLLF